MHSPPPYLAIYLLHISPASFLASIPFHFIPSSPLVCTLSKIPIWVVGCLLGWVGLYVSILTSEMDSLVSIGEIFLLLGVFEKDTLEGKEDNIVKRARKTLSSKSIYWIRFNLAILCSLLFLLALLLFGLVSRKEGSWADCYQVHLGTWEREHGRIARHSSKVYLFIDLGHDFYLPSYPVINRNSIENDPRRLIVHSD